MKIKGGGSIEVRILFASSAAIIKKPCAADLVAGAGEDDREGDVVAGHIGAWLVQPIFSFTPAASAAK